MVTAAPASAAVATLLHTLLVNVLAVRVSTRDQPAPEGDDGDVAAVDSARTSASPALTFEGTDTDMLVALATVWLSPTKLTAAVLLLTATDRVAVSDSPPLSVTVSCTE